VLGLQFCDLAPAVIGDAILRRYDSGSIRFDCTMSEALQITVGGLLALIAWLIPLRVADARAARSPALFLDLFPVLLAGSLALIATGRPIFTGVVLISLAQSLCAAVPRAARRRSSIGPRTLAGSACASRPHARLEFAVRSCRERAS
jgi:hypothetical protein